MRSSAGLTSTIINACSAASRSTSARRPPPRFPPTSASRASRPATIRSSSRCCLPVRPLPADRFEPPRRPAREPAGHLERLAIAPAWDSKYTGQHQHRDELLAGRSRPTWPSATRRSSTRSKISPPPARITAKEHYDARGWVLHHNFDLWRGTAPINNSNHGIWPTGGAWLAQHLWEHYLYSGDKRFLRDDRLSAHEGRRALLRRLLWSKTRKTGWLISGPEQFARAGRPGDGTDDGPPDHPRALRQRDRSRRDPRRSTREFRDTARRRCASGSRRTRSASTASCRNGSKTTTIPKNQHRHVSHLWGAAPGRRDHAARHAGPLRRRAASRSSSAATAAPAGRWAGRSTSGRDSSTATTPITILQNLLTPAVQPTDGVHGGGVYRQPLRRASALPDRRQLRRHRRHRRDAAAKPRPLRHPDQSHRVQSGEAAFIHLLPALPSALPPAKSPDSAPAATSTSRSPGATASSTAPLSLPKSRSPSKYATPARKLKSKPAPANSTTSTPA